MGMPSGVNWPGENLTTLSLCVNFLAKASPNGKGIDRIRGLKKR
jgi:hypothetical protein